MLEEAAAGALPLAVPGWSADQNAALAAEFAVEAARTLEHQARHERLTGLGLPLAAGRPSTPPASTRTPWSTIAEQLRDQLVLEAA